MARHTLQWTKWLTVQRLTATATIRQCNTVCWVWTHLITWLNDCVSDQSYVSEYEAIEKLHIMQFEQPLNALRRTDKSYCALLKQSAHESPGVTKTSALIVAHALHIMFTTSVPARRQQEALGCPHRSEGRLWSSFSSIDECFSRCGRWRSTHSRSSEENAMGHD